MKIKQIESILKARKTIIAYQANDVQWLGDGAAIYPVFNMPKLTQSNIFTMFDIPEQKREKYHFSELPLPSYINFDDVDESEQILERDMYSIYVQGCILEPLKTQTGIQFINSRYLKPFDGTENGYELYERIDKHGKTYIAVKSGYSLLGIIAPFDLIDENFISQTETLLNLSRVALCNKNYENAEKQYSFYEELRR